MELIVKQSDELSTDELYEILKLRVSVFVVEQKCAYQEIDGRDRSSIHVWLADEDGIEAYLRVMDSGVESEYVSIGRVLTVKRHQGLGSRILAEGVRVAKENFHAEKIYLEAQVYARSMYEKQGFVQISEEYLEDGIPHVKMLLDSSKS